MIFMKAESQKPKVEINEKPEAESRKLYFYGFLIKLFHKNQEFLHSWCLIFNMLEIIQFSKLFVKKPKLTNC